MKDRDLDKISDYSRWARKIIVTDEMREKTKRVVCGAQSIKDAADAALMLQALGLLPYPEVSNEVRRTATA